MSAEKLSPCPFPKCGSPTVEIQVDNDGLYFVRCHTCGSMSGRCGSMQAAVDFWNTRVDAERSWLIAELKWALEGVRAVTAEALDRYEKAQQTLAKIENQ